MSMSRLYAVYTPSFWLAKRSSSFPGSLSDPTSPCDEIRLSTRRIEALKRVPTALKCRCAFAEAFLGTHTQGIRRIAAGLKQPILGHPVLLHGPPPWPVMAEEENPHGVTELWHDLPICRCMIVEGVDAPHLRYRPKSLWVKRIVNLESGIGHDGLAGGYSGQRLERPFHGNIIMEELCGMVDAMLARVRVELSVTSKYTIEP
ncbi:hypothetical protein BGY98DRAFT_938258 [Russula aff. rugulosa BPL654]|nr:hypothetical protein BGY98DRAFT_938258 [Russula aff. rugulosa BPL654]